jgi:hypothetical protein
MKATLTVPGRPGQPNKFRRSLPDRVQQRLFAPLPKVEPEVAAAMERRTLRSPDVNVRALTARDVREFLLAYCACFLALQMFLT